MNYVNPTRTRSCSEFERCGGKAAIADDRCCCSGRWDYRSGVRKRIVRCIIRFGRDGGGEQSGEEDLTEGKHFI